MKTYYNYISKSFVTYTNFEPQDKKNLVEVDSDVYNDYLDKLNSGYKAEVVYELGVLKFKYTEPERAEIIAKKLEEKRVQRKTLLQAFDIYKTNVMYGIIIETEEEHEAIMTWYQKLLDLNTSALNNVPAQIKRYL